jgi:hypothetical protein
LKRIISFILLVAVVFTIVYIVSSIIESYTARKTREAKTELSITLYQLLDSLEKNPDLATSLRGKYIETEGSLLTMGPEHGGGSYIYFIAYQQTDSSFEVAHALDYKTVLKKQNWSACDSAIVDYQKLFSLQETPLKITAIASVASSLTNEQERVTYCKYCEPYTITTNKTQEFYLQNFCYEKVRVKALVHHILKKETGYEVVLGNGILLSKTRIEKK